MYLYVLLIDIFIIANHLKYFSSLYVRQFIFLPKGDVLKRHCRICSYLSLHLDTFRWQIRWLTWKEWRHNLLKPFEVVLNDIWFVRLKKFGDRPYRSLEPEMLSSLSVSGSDVKAVIS